MKIEIKKMLDINPLYEIVLWYRENVSPLTKDEIIDLIIHAPSYYLIWWKSIFDAAPLHIFIETALVLFIFWLIFIRRTIDPKRASKNEKLTEKEINWLVDEWIPEPLIPDLNETDTLLAKNMTIIDSMEGNYIKVRGIANKIINFGSMDFLGFSRSKEVKDASISALEKYGCGSCGPRGFYGTIDTHLNFEDVIAKFMGTEESIAYSDSASAVSSTIPAFSKKGDLLIIDDACNESIMQGCNLSRSTLLYFKHNDMADLELLLKNVVADDKKFKRKSSDQRRFIVTEGLFSNTGNICPLPDILKLKEKYCYRLMMDESLSFGTMGATGRGITEHFRIPITDIEIINIAMDTVLASVGGLCIGTREVVDHQRLSGAGYCFSAAAPPFLSSAASASLKLLQENPETIEKLRSNSVYLYEKLKNIKGLKLVSSCGESPIIHLNFDSEPISKADDEYKIIQLARLCLENGVGVVSSKYIIVQHLKSLRPSIKLCVSACHTHKEMDTAIAGIKAAMKQMSS